MHTLHTTVSLEFLFANIGILNAAHPLNWKPRSPHKRPTLTHMCAPKRNCLTTRLYGQSENNSPLRGANSKIAKGRDNWRQNGVSRLSLYMHMPRLALFSFVCVQNLAIFKELCATNSAIGYIVANAAECSKYGFGWDCGKQTITCHTDAIVSYHFTLVDFSI